MARTREITYEEALDQSISEKEFQSETESLFRSMPGKNWQVYHTLRSKGSEPGFPDLVLIDERGRLVAIELKVRDYVPTAHQERWLRAFRRAGAEVYVFWPRHRKHITQVALGARSGREGVLSK